MNTLPRAKPSEMGIDAKGLLSFVERLGEKGCRSFMVLRLVKVIEQMT